MHEDIYECMQTSINVYVCRHVCMHIWMYTFRYICIQTLVWMCMYVCMYVCMYACMHAHQVPTPMSLYKDLVYWTIILPHCKYEPHSHYATWAYRLSICAYVCQNTADYNIYFTCYCHIGASSKYASQMPRALVYIHFTLWAYTSPQICLPYYTCMS